MSTPINIEIFNALEEIKGKTTQNKELTEQEMQVLFLAALLEEDA
jgi:hypothetical protein